MARALRLEIVAGRYHVTSRGNERRAIFRQDADRFHFLELCAQLPVRFGVRLHAFVLMDNHYHLVIETREANLSRAIQWLNEDNRGGNSPRVGGEPLGALGGR